MKKTTPRSARSARGPAPLPAYDPAAIEKKWQKKWASSKLYRTAEDPKKEKFYVLDMFPYPSGEGLHVGHPKGYIATDVVSRMKRMQGKSVLHPMGFDAFGLPAENYALKTKTHPAAAVKKNVERYKKQLEILGFDYDWSREINTTDPAYYRWTQWIFLQLYKKGLAYESFEPINWCPSCKTDLANEDLEDGRCERCGTPVEKKPLRQWVLRITDYAERLLNDLDAVRYEMPRLADRTNPHQPGKPVVKRAVVHAIVYDPAVKKYLIIRNKKHGWNTVVIGGIENGETAEEAARREVREETGYTDLEFKRILGGPTEASYYAKHKGENRVAIAQAAYFELKSPTRVPLADGEDADNEILWIEEQNFVPGKMVNSELPIWLERLADAARGNPELLLDWPESIKELQRNWIGRSEGASLKFALADSDKTIEVFTTRPDTLYGVTYVVLAPEHALVKELAPQIENLAEVESYATAVAAETAITRTDGTREKSGVRLKGISAIHPLTKEKLPVWIADYVLADYGSGAVMAVPAHDERDFAFAKRFGLPIRQVIAAEFGVKRENEERRDGGCALIFDLETQKYAVYEEPDGEIGFFGGGVENDEDLQQGIIREVEEESGLHDFQKIEIIETADAHYYHSAKKLNRIAGATCLLAILKSSSMRAVKREAHENFQLKWMTALEIEQRLQARNKNKDVDHWLRFLSQAVSRAIELKYDTTSNPEMFKATAYTGAGRLINSASFTGRESTGVRKEITEAAGGTWTTAYKLRDWVFSRQRYWGEPIPLIHCENCGVVPVPEKDLPVKLPNVKSYEPTGTGESPLAAITKWVNVKCPKCKGKATRETNTMPQWAGSCWYYLRYEDPRNKKAAVDPKKEKYWSPVDLYVGGAEHATRHLIYARFWHKVLYDLGVVHTIEPFTKLQSVGLIMGEDGRKMGKRYGNVVNPDEIVAAYGADTLRIYEMFMGPFDQQIAWNTSSMVGARRFIERVWKLRSKVGSAGSQAEFEGKAGSAERVIHKAVKKVAEDIEALRFNTAISALMIAVNELEKEEKIAQEQYETLLKLVAPFAPHAAEELWSSLGARGSIHTSEWPVADPALLVEEEIRIAVQVNGKVRGSFNTTQNTNREEMAALAEKVPDVQKWLSKGKIIKTIVVPGRLVNFVIEETGAGS